MATHDGHESHDKCNFVTKILQLKMKVRNFAYVVTIM